MESSSSLLLLSSLLLSSLLLCLSWTKAADGALIPETRGAVPAPALLNGPTCGVNKYGSGADKIVGGHETEAHQYPWLVSLWVEYPEWGMDNHMCGGTLISPQYIVTAAHCTKELGGPEFEDPKVWKALVGAHNFNNLDAAAKWIKIEKIVVNDYSILSHANDIAIWKLAEPVDIDTEKWSRNTLCLPSPKADLDLSKLKCVVSGWGLLTENGIAATVLQEVTLPVISVEKCRTYYPEKIWFPKKIHDSNICAGLEEGGKDSCQGDSGGPYMCVDPATDRYFLAGIVSWGNGCANAGRPGVLTDPRAFLRWISDTIAKME